MVCVELDDHEQVEAIHYTNVSLGLQMFPVPHQICDTGGTFDIAHTV